MVWQAIFVLIGVNALPTVLGPTPPAAQSFTYNRLKDMLMGSPPPFLSLPTVFCYLLCWFTVESSSQKKVGHKKTHNKKYKISVVCLQHLEKQGVKMNIMNIPPPPIFSVHPDYLNTLPFQL